MEKSINRILFVIPGKKIDSPQSMPFAKKLAVSLEKLGVKVDILISVRTANPLYFLKQGLKLREIYRATNPDLVVAQCGSITALFVVLFAPRPIVITYRGSDLNPTPSENRVYVFFKHAASHISSFFAAGIVCVSKELASRLTCRKMVEVIPSSTDTELFHPMDRKECRKELGWDIDSPIAIFFVGNSPGKKRLDTALEVQSKITDNKDGVQFKIITEEVPLSRMPVYLNAADCLVFLSSFEGSPNLIREACACETPIVTVPVGDVAEVLEGVEPGMIVERDAGRIAAAACEIARQRKRSNGRMRAMDYSSEITARKTLSFYENIVSRTKGWLPAP